MQTEITQRPKTTRKLGPRRAQAKQATQEKLVSAARKLFSTQGYDASTLRQIASAAGIGLATLFTHIHDKRDLIYLIFVPDMQESAVKSAAAVRPWHSFIQKVLAMNEPVLRLFAAEATLARILLTESFLDLPGPHYQAYLSLRIQAMARMEEAVRVAKEAGEIDPAQSAEVVASSIYFAFSGYVRWWIAGPQPDWHRGQEAFEQILKLMLYGMQPRGEETKTKLGPGVKGKGVRAARRPAKSR